jgi:hypothetical protein
MNKKSNANPQGLAFCFLFAFPSSSSVAAYFIFSFPRAERHFKGEN